ncbi:MAG: hypothetical protein EXR33_08920 [Betaproteobacteria bacterium]|nr:hypothetical protein [Betaproteobacteria bacterium]
MPLIAMNREMGSLGEDVARGLEQALGMKIRHHEIIDHIASRLRILTADEILSVAASGEPVILRDAATSHHLHVAEVPARLRH